MKHPIDIYCVAKATGDDNYHVTIVVELPIKDFVKEVDITLTPEEIRSIVSVTEKLNDKCLGFNLHVKVKD